MKLVNFGHIAAEYDQEPLVKQSTAEYPDGYGVHIRFGQARDIRKAIKGHRSKLYFLAQHVGILKLTAAEGDFNMRGVLSGNPLNDRPRRSLPLHVDLKGNVDEEEKNRHRFTTAFCPEYWVTQVQALWQNATLLGRSASTVWAPPSVCAEAMKDTISTPTSTLLDREFLKEEEVFFWGRLMELLFNSINKIGPDPVALMMVFKDIVNLLHDRQSPAARPRYLGLSERLTESVLTQVEPWSYEMDWQSPEALKGAVILFGGKGKPKLLHTRRNKGKRMGRPTVLGA